MDLDLFKDDPDAERKEYDYTECGVCGLGCVVERDTGERALSSMTEQTVAERFWAEERRKAGKHLVQAAAPAIRARERERLREALLGQAGGLEELREDEDPGCTARAVRLAKAQGIRDALDTLEDPSDQRP